MDWARLGTALVSGGASEVARRVDERAEKIKQEVKQDVKDITTAVAQTIPKGGSACCQPTSIEVNSCSHYRFEGGFLLDSENGRMWRFDEKANELLIVKRQMTDIERSWESLLRAKATADLVEDLTNSSKGASLGERLRLDPLVEPHIKRLDDHVKALGKGPVG